MSDAIAVSREKSLNEDDDAVVRARDDAAAFGELYERYAKRVYRFVRPRATSDEEAADVTQQVFVKALAALPGYRPGRAPFAAWLFRIARNVATDAYRRRRTHLPIEAALGVQDDADLDAAAIRSERLDRLRLEIERLDLPGRELLALRFAAGLTSAEIGAVVSRPETAVKKQLTRIINKLKERCRE